MHAGMSCTKQHAPVPVLITLQSMALRMADHQPGHSLAAMVLQSRNRSVAASHVSCHRCSSDKGAGSCACQVHTHASRSCRLHSRLHLQKLAIFRCMARQPLLSLLVPAPDSCLSMKMHAGLAADDLHGWLTVTVSIAWTEARGAHKCPGAGHQPPGYLAA